MAEQNLGQLIRVAGPVLDVRFPEGMEPPEGFGKRPGHDIAQIIGKLTTEFSVASGENYFFGITSAEINNTPLPDSGVL